MKKCILGLFVVFCLFSSVIISWADSEEYRISTNDLLEISVYEEPDLAKTVRVDANGVISYPLLGSIKVNGFTAKELESKITGLLFQDYLVNPQVSVFIKEYAKVSILGQVNKPGSYELKTSMTVMDAIALAGGFTVKTNAKDIKLVRIKGSNKETIGIDANEIVDKGHKEKDIRLEPGDLIIVGEISESSNFIVVLGQVRSPGRYAYKEGMSAIEAIALAGGLTDTAAANGTRIIRLKNGRKLNIRIPVASILNGGNRDKDVPLEAEDTVVVPESFF
jgi:polysaccharide export outer membrane protein